MATVGKLSADSMAAIGRELRLKYKEIIAEGMPERFAKILRRLDEPSNEGVENRAHQWRGQPCGNYNSPRKDAARPCDV